MIDNTTSNEDEQWAPVSDLMAALMLVFMLITVLFIHILIQQEDVFKNSVKECDEMYRELKTKFDSEKLGVALEVTDDMAIRFKRVQYKSGDPKIPDDFKEFLKDFFPSYVEFLYKQSDERDIQEIRIEGHTSTKWLGVQAAGAQALGERKAYIENMKLSQDRARIILEYYILDVDDDASRKKWAESKITANGLSSSKLIYFPDGRENEADSRRVEFRVIVSACEKAGRYQRDRKERS